MKCLVVELYVKLIHDLKGAEAKGWTHGGGHYTGIPTLGYDAWNSKAVVINRMPSTAGGRLQKDISYGT
jgi:hypothetical protein